MYCQIGMINTIFCVVKKKQKQIKKNIITFLKKYNKTKTIKQNLVNLNKTIKNSSQNNEVNKILSD